MTLLFFATHKPHPMPVALLPVITGKRKQVLVNSGKATGHIPHLAYTA